MGVSIDISSRGSQAKQSRQFSIYITLQVRGQLAQLPDDQGSCQRDQPTQPKNRGNTHSRCRKILLASCRSEARRLLYSLGVDAFCKYMDDRRGDEEK